MSRAPQVVITGVGVVSPIGIGRAAFWDSLMAQRSGVGPLSFLESGSMPVYIGAEVTDFDPKELIKPRKSLKVMSREIQLAVVAAEQAMADAGLAAGALDPERLGVVLGADMIQADPADMAAAFRRSMVDGRFDFSHWWPSAMSEIYPLWFLKLLPNMPACHIGIAHDARGPNNSITMNEVSGLLAVGEAFEVIRREQADAVLTGATGSRIHPTRFARGFADQVSHRNDDPAAASRPFDAERDGMVNGEGAAVFVLESGEHAQARGARVLARVLGHASAFEPRGETRRGLAVRSGARKALEQAGLAPRDVGHVNAHGLATTDDDRMEALAIRDILGDVPVTAPKSYFGNLGSGAGSVEMAASVLALANNVVPATLNYEHPDPQCPVNVIRGQPLQGAKPVALLLNHTTLGQAASLVLAAE